MSNHPIVITGCQRSGTTLLNLIMNSHPDVCGVDESQFVPGRIAEFLASPGYGPYVCFKLPGQAHSLDWFRKLPGVRIIWAARDPRDVVASMIRLRIVAGDVKERMAAHPRAGARVQVPATLQVLGKLPPDLENDMRAFTGQVQTPPARRTPEQLAVAASLHWRLKQELLRLYEAAGLAYYVVNYESLVIDPDTEIRRLMQYLGLRWHDDVLRHHQLHSGRSIGDTDNTRAIDQRSMGRWKEALDATQLACVRRICGPAAARLGYVL